MEISLNVLGQQKTHMGHLHSVHASKRKFGESNYSYISERATKLIQIPRHKNPFFLKNWQKFAKKRN